MSQLVNHNNAGLLLRLGIFGNQVIKGPLTLPQNGTLTLATVSGGLVLITSMFGIVTTAIGATVTNLSVGTVPTTGTASTGAISAPTPITSAGVGCWLTPVQSAGVAGQLAVGALAGNAIYLCTPFIVSAGLITWHTDANNTGQVKWYFTYVPVDTGAALS
jgi:hypothetical protein